jgi:hypothetical protein
VVIELHSFCLGTNVTEPIHSVKLFILEEQLSPTTWCSVVHKGSFIDWGLSDDRD